MTFRRPFDWRSLAFCRPARADARPAFADLCGNQPVSEVILRSIAWTFVSLHAIEQMQLRRQHRVDGVGRPTFDFHTVADDCAAGGGVFSFAVATGAEPISPPRGLNVTPVRWYSLT